MNNLTIDLLFDADFEESKHPRAKGGSKGGQFVKKGESSGSAPATKPAKPVSKQRAASIASGQKAMQANARKFGMTEATWNKHPELKQEAVWYMKKASRKMNAMLRGETKMDSKMPARIAALDKAFEMPEGKLKSDVTLHRTMIVEPKFLADIRKTIKQGNGALTQKGFTSTSLRDDMFVANGMVINPHVRLEITAKKGSPALLLGSVDAEHHEEAEVLLPRNARIKVHAIEPATAEQIHAEQLNSNTKFYLIRCSYE